LVEAEPVVRPGAAPRHIMVTGGAGFIGSHLATHLIRLGHQVTVLDDLSTGKLENIPPEAAFIRLDLGQRQEYGKIAPLRADAVFHLAGQSSGEASFADPWKDCRSHVLSTFWLLEWCRMKQVDRFIYASSMSTYGEPRYLPVDENHPQQPLTFYAAGKIAAEAYVKLYQTLGVNTTIFRLFSVYGPGQNLENQQQGMVSIYLSYLLADEPIVVKGSQDRFRDFIYIDDVVHAWLAAWENQASYGNIYNLASGAKTTVADLLTALKNAAGRPDFPVICEDNTPGDQHGVVGDNGRVSRDLHWRPKTDLPTGLSTMVEFEQRRRKIGN
jgi:UDP-glucose 4-epimerase